MTRLAEIGLGSSTLMKATLPEFIEIAARHGFRSITARPYAFMQALREGHSGAALRKRLADAGVKITMIDGLNNGLPGIPSPDMLSPEVRAIMPPDVLTPADIDACLYAATTLEADMLNVIAYRGSIMPVEQMAEAIGVICHRAAGLGVRIALEFLPDSGLPDLAQALAVREACGEPHCGIMLDVFHLARSGGTVEDVRGLPLGAISGVQISDRVPDGGTQRLMPGDGTLPLHDIVTAALANNADARVDIEVLNAELAALPSEEAAARLAAAAARWQAAFA